MQGSFNFKISRFSSGGCTMNLNPRIGLSFDGRCEAAFKFYERSLNGKLEFMLRWGDSPMSKDAPPDWRDKILHARLVIGDAELLGADSLPGTYEAPRGFSLLISPSDAAEADRVFAVLAQNGTIRIPLQESFWAPRFCAVTDQFGITWTINLEKSE
jgi:PhnB protein